MKISETAKKIGQGNLDVEITFRSKDELGILAASFNQMAKNLKKITASRDELNREIEERKEAENALRQSEEKFRSLSGAAFEGIVISQKGIMIEFNDTFCKMLGYLPSELIGKSAPNLIVPPEERENVKSKILAGYEQPYETRCLRKDGSILPTEAQAKMFSYKGEQVRVTAIRDISERKEAENALRQSEEKFAKVFEHSPLLMAITEIDDGTVLDVNEAFLKHLGYSRHEVIGNTTLSLGLYVNLPDRETIIGYLKTTDKAGSLDFKMRKKNGATITISYFGEIINIGGVQRAFSIIEDISDRKKIEKKLIDSEANLRRAQEVGKMGSWFLDLSNNILEWSEEVYRIFNVSQEAMITYDKFLTLIHPDDREFASAAWEAALNREPYDIEHRIVVDGVEKWVREIAEVEFDIDGKAVSGIGTIQDITERKQAEEEIKEKEKVESIVEMAGTVCHELSQPLQIITGYSDILAMNVSEDDQKYKNLLKITKQVERMEILLQKLNKITMYKTKTHDTKTKMIDLDKSSE